MREWRKFGAELGGYQKRLAAQGVYLAWHNHDFEFEKLADGSYPLDHMFEAAPDLLWEADIGWLHVAGEDPLLWIEEIPRPHQGRAHQGQAPNGENADEDGWADIGARRHRLEEADAGAQRAEREYLVLEHDNPADYERFARRSCATVAAW